MSKVQTETFVDACLRGAALLDDIDDWVDDWHAAEGRIDQSVVSLHDYLGMSRDEYGLWVEQPKSLRFIIAAHRRGAPVEEVLTSSKHYALAARSDDDAATREVLVWLVRTGRLSPDAANID